jgi:hypothetical protein
VTLEAAPKDLIIDLSDSVGTKLPSATVLYPSTMTCAGCGVPLGAELFHVLIRRATVLTLVCW